MILSFGEKIKKSRLANVFCQKRLIINVL